MGGDGGVVAANRAYMRQCTDPLKRAKEAKRNTKETLVLRTKVCAISQEALRQPVVACELGYLYTKEVVLSALLDKSLNAAFSHIRSMRDLIPVKFTEEAEGAEGGGGGGEGGGGRGGGGGGGEGGGAAAGGAARPYICPVTSLQFNGLVPFVVVRTTGWVLSDKAVREVGVSGLQEEYGPFQEGDLIRLAPSDDEREGEMRTRMEARRERAAQDKKERKEESKKRKKKEAEASLHKGEGPEGEHEVEVAAAAAAAAAEKKSKKRQRKEQKAAAGAAAATAAAAPGTGTFGGTGGLHGSSSAAASAASSIASAAVKAAMASNSVLNELLHDKKTTAPDALFITTSGYRYNQN